MDKNPIIDKLLELNQKNIISFHVPGHKNGKIYDKIKYKNFKDILYKLDTTEILGTDNLHNAKKIIKQSQEKASRVFKSEETFFLVNGTTSGIYSIIMASTSPGDKILIDRNCHQSVINATILADLVPVYVYPEIDKKQDLSMGILPEDIENQLKNHKDIKAVILTYPTYFGIGYDLKKIEKIVHKYDKILLIDEAHGSHLGLSEDLPKPALSLGADAAVQSTHKTLPSFTQSSMLHIQGDRINKDKLKFMLKIHQSSSPSYLLLSSLDFAVELYRTRGKDLMEDLLKNIQTFKRELKKIDGFNIIGEEIIGSNGVDTLDLTRLWISHKSVGGYQLDRLLRQDFNIQMELSNNYGVLAITSIANDTGDFDRLLNALNEISKNLEYTSIKNKTSEDRPYMFTRAEQVYTPREALYKDKQNILLEKSEGYISGEYITPYPPGIPLIIPGERIDREVIDQVKTIINGGGEIIGLKDSSCKTIDIIKE